jgi:catechol 2,3-dioxygenase-like lactoylglutathione lyase family enzyme
MLGSAALIAFLPSRDLDRSRRFFESLGLVAEEVTPFACVLRAGATMLRVTKVEALTPHPFTVLGWQVPEMADAVAGLATAGVTFLRFDGVDQDADGVWTTPGGDRVAWFHDPDGNTLSLTQFASAAQ